MFLKTTALSGTITSGSTATGNLVDVSDYSKLWIEMTCSGSIAGTGSLYLTSISQADVEPAGMVNAPAFGQGQPAAQTLTINGGSGWAYVSASILPVDAKWAVYQFVETSGSAAGTGSVVVKWSLLQ